jgi:hypothetical protein
VTTGSLVAGEIVLIVSSDIMQGIYDSTNMKRREGSGEDVGEGDEGQSRYSPLFVISYRENEVIVVEALQGQIPRGYIRIAQALSIHL